MSRDKVRTTYSKISKLCFLSFFKISDLDFWPIWGPWDPFGTPLGAFGTLLDPFVRLGSEAPPYDRGEVITFCLEGIRKKVYILFRRG